MRTALQVELSSEQRTALERLARARSEPARVAERARIVLLAADGLENQQIAWRMGITPEKAARWAEALSGGRHLGFPQGRTAAGAHAHHHRSAGEGRSWK